MKSIRYSALFASLLLFSSQDSIATDNEGASARLIGMGRTSMAARGFETAGINPAFLVLSDRGVFQFALASVGFRFGSNFMDYGLYRDYFTGIEDPMTGERVSKHLSESDKEDIISRFPGGTGRLLLDARVTWAAVWYKHDLFGGISVSVSDRFSGRADIPVDYAKMILFGFEETGSRYEFNGTSIQSWWLREYAVSYGTPRLELGLPLRWISFGAGMKIVHGYGYFGTESYEGYISNTDLTQGFRIEGEIQIVSRRSTADFIHAPELFEFNPLGEPAGRGIGFDLGVAAGLTSSITAGISVTDLGRLNWSGNTYGSYGHGTIVVDDIFDEAQQDSLKKAFTGTEAPIGTFTTPLASTLRAGVTWQFDHVFSAPGTLLLAASYTQGLNSMPGTSTVPRFAVGAEWRPIGFLPIRTGFSYDADLALVWSAGIGLNLFFFDLEFATENLGLLMYPDWTKHASAAITTKLRF